MTYLLERFAQASKKYLPTHLRTLFIAEAHPPTE